VIDYCQHVATVLIGKPSVLDMAFDSLGHSLAINVALPKPVRFDFFHSAKIISNSSTLRRKM
jgi:hypothetical protein